MGKLSWYSGYLLCRDPVLASNMDDMEITTCGELKHTYDVYTNAGKLCVGR